MTEAKKYLESLHVLIRSDRTDVRYRRVACIRQLNDACHGIISGDTITTGPRVVGDGSCDFILSEF